uniref:Uncharacterized protein n=1 Tax=Anguilla anguilla TaxID=7936 RepID=A0A0E9REL7_ANGAN
MRTKIFSEGLMGSTVHSFEAATNNYGI